LTVRGLVVLSAQPDDVHRLVIIWMVAVDLVVATDGARFTFNQAAAKC
jgi:hypothetical protein